MFCSAVQILACIKVSSTSLDGFSIEDAKDNEQERNEAKPDQRNQCSG